MARKLRRAGRGKASTRKGVLTEAVAAAAGNLSEHQQALFAAFVREILPQLRAPILERYPVEKLPELLLEHYLLVRNRHQGELHLEFSRSGEDRTVLRSCMADQPFIVDTVRLFLRSLDVGQVQGFNAVLSVRRDKRGRVVAFGDERGSLESVIQLEILGLSEELFGKAELVLRDNLRLVEAMVRDFKDMTEGVDGVARLFETEVDKAGAKASDLQEAADFLDWLLADNFVFMGALFGKTRLGFERSDLPRKWRASPWKEGQGTPPTISVRKSVQESPVHRAGRIDEVRILVPRERGKPMECLVRGMFTYRAVTQASRHVPLLRLLLRKILESDASLPGSWRYKGLANAFDSLPTEFLLTASLGEIRELLDHILEAEAEQGTRVHMVQKSQAKTSFVLAAMPREQYSDRLSKRMQKTIMEATGATYSDHGVLVGRYDTVLVHYFLTGATSLPAGKQRALRDRLAAMATPWTEQLHAALVERGGETNADRLVERYARAFEEEYVRRARIEGVLRDLDMLESLQPGYPVLVDLFLDERERLNLRIYQSENMLLSDILPLLDNFGVVVIDQFADPVHLGPGQDYTIDTFRLDGALGLTTAEVVARGANLGRGLEAVFAGLMEDDSLNRLLLVADIPWEDVDLVRAYLGYARQVGLHFKGSRVQEILLRHPLMVRRLVEYFRVRFTPVMSGSRKRAQESAVEAVEAGLRSVSNRDDDLLLRTLFNLMQATTRTNAFRRDRSEHYISFKLDHDKIASLPQPRLKYEIYVHHARLEGVHLRGGLVARGGIRWSDREDFRTEILGLVSTQMVKNVLIVPTGSKGGFFLKSAPIDPQERRAEADRLYRVFIRGLLDLTDNMVEGRVCPPPEVVPYDSPDPYLVVAADKGTAHLSDTANGVAGDFGFWLGDAFASGGSVGYDHKKVGITARGAWQCVRRHMRELGLNPEADSFSCMGIGDPAGDVFGNGVLEYEKMRLVGAFNHKHIFLDPNPRGKKSRDELRRLFEAAQGWEHFEHKVLGAGGGIFDRRSKLIALTPEVQQMLGTLKTELPPDTVIRLMLRLPVDLWWNGGIGTYVKASWESHRDADDSANDNLRVNADELRCRVVGEGGNLGFTQAGRVEFALGGGAINTDALDNSGGVDMSDHEVNLKILLGGLVDKGALKQGARNTLIRRLTKEIAGQVLENNDLHALQVSLDRVRSLRDTIPFGRAIEWVAEEGGDSALVMGLPNRDQLARRMDSRTGLSRPELAVLSAHVKMHLQKRLESQDPARIPGMDAMRLAYFPKAIRRDYPREIADHMLADQVGWTVALTRMVADTGATFVPSLLDLTSRESVEIMGAWYHVRDHIKLDSIRTQIGGCTAPVEARFKAWVNVTDAVLGLLAVSLAPGGDGVDPEHLAATAEVLGRLGRHRGRSDRARIAGVSEGLVAKGMASGIADKVAGLGELSIASEIAAIRPLHGDSLRDSVVRYLAIGNASRLLGAIRVLEVRRAAGHWDQVATGILRTRYFGLLRALVERTPLEGELKLGVDRASFRLGRGALKGVGEMVDHIVGESPDVGALLVAEERLRGAVLRGLG